MLAVERDEIEAKTPEIAELTELRESLLSDLFLRHVYPACLRRLGDLGDGACDVKFADKARRRMLEFTEQGKILVFESQNPSSWKACALERLRLSTDA